MDMKVSVRNHPEPDSSTGGLSPIKSASPPSIDASDKNKLDQSTRMPTTEKALPKSRLRRVKANGRERNRMHGLNKALDTLRACVPLSTHHQKLSKIETLRLARNYITALDRILQTGHNPSSFEYAQILCRGMSQTTTNLIASYLHVHPRLLMPDHFAAVYRAQGMSVAPPMDAHTSDFVGRVYPQGHPEDCAFSPPIHGGFGDLLSGLNSELRQQPTPHVATVSSTVYPQPPSEQYYNASYEFVATPNSSFDASGYSYDSPVADNVYHDSGYDTSGLTAQSF
uniref:BHLH domain-containing protein n=1 Tax=Plectus sambesii TaxID=2011161 RepID=A0A914UM36_9BILA